MTSRSSGRKPSQVLVALATGAFAASVLGGCGGDSKSSTAETAAASVGDGFLVADTAAPAATEAPAAEAPAFTEAAAADVPLDASAGAAPPATAPTGDGAVVAVQTIPGRAIIFEGSLTLVTSDIAGAAAEITRIAAESGGTVFDSEIHPEDPEHAHATVTIKVPPEGIGTVMERIGKLGRLTDYSQDAQDVTMQMIDLDARILTATASVERVRGFLDETRNVSELAGLEAELTVRETELEQLRAQQRALNDRVALATLTIDVVLPPRVETPTTTIAPVPVTHEPLTAASAFAKSRHALWQVLVAIAIVAAAVAPFLAVFGVPLLLGWFVTRRARRRNRRGAPTAAPTPDDAAEQVHETV